MLALACHKSDSAALHAAVRAVTIASVVCNVVGMGGNAAASVFEFQLAAIGALNALKTKP